MPTATHLQQLCQQLPCQQLFSYQLLPCQPSPCAPAPAQPLSAPSHACITSAGVLDVGKVGIPQSLGLKYLTCAAFSVLKYVKCCCPLGLDD